MVSEHFNKIIPLIILVLSLSCSKKNSPITPDSGVPTLSFLRAADLSFQPEIQSDNAEFFDSSAVKIEVLPFLASNGWNAVRLRLWVNPTDNHSGFAEVKAYAKQVRDQNLPLWLCIHYSDEWADPGNQNTPSSWSGMNSSILEDSVRSYTLRVVEALQPEIVQVGNEINHGFLWPQGSIDSTDTFISLLKAGLESVHEANPSSIRMVHLAGQEASVYWQLQLLEEEAVSYEWLGLSYYPWWHGKDLDQLSIQLIELSQLTNRPIGIAETAYPFTLDWNDWTNNIVGLPEHLIPGIPASAGGQATFLHKIDSICGSIPNSWGWAYWAPDCISWKGPNATDGSSLENLALFDFESKALPSAYLNK